MRFLLYKVYESGFANDLMSIEMAVGLAHLTGRTLVFYGSADDDDNIFPVRGGHWQQVQESRKELIDQSRRPTILDLLEPLPVPTLPLADLRRLTREYGLQVSDSDIRLPLTVFITASNVPLEWCEAFAAGRRIIYNDPPEDIWHLYECNLAYYSRAIYPLKQEALDVLSGVQIRSEYRSLAALVAADLGPFNGLHMRLTDFRTFLPYAGDDYASAVLKTLQEVFDPRLPLVISTDESHNVEFFAGILAAFPHTRFVDDFIVNHHADAFRALPFNDESAFGVVCNLVMRHANQFIGTPGSTFTGLIHRAWGNRCAALGLPLEALEFRYVTSGASPGSVPFSRGAYVVVRTGPFTWNRIEIAQPTDMLSWYREWPEACMPSAELPEPRPSSERDAPISNSEIEALLFAENHPSLPEAGKPVQPIKLSEESSGRSHWVRWALVGFLLLQLFAMGWPGRW